MKHTDYKNIIEAAHKLTGSQAKTREGAWKALRPWIAKQKPIHARHHYFYPGPASLISHLEQPRPAMRTAWYRYQWRQRAERGAETIMREMKLKNRWEDLTSKRPRDKFNRELASERRAINRNAYGALMVSGHVEPASAGVSPMSTYPATHMDWSDHARYHSESKFRSAYLSSDLAAPAGWYSAWKCVSDIEANADEHGGWEQRSDWDGKGRGEQITVDLYGIDADARLYVIQVRQSFRQHKNWFLSIRKSYFMIGYNENGNPFAHPISAGIVHGAIKRDPAPESPVRAAQAWIWGIDESKLPAVLRNGDVALIPAKCPQKDMAIFAGGEYRVDDDVAADHYLVADEVRANGAIYAKNPMIYHRKGQHPAAHGEGWFKVVVGRRADFWSFARPTVD